MPRGHSASQEEALGDCTETREADLTDWNWFTPDFTRPFKQSSLLRNLFIIVDG